MVKQAKPKPKTPKEQHATFLSEVEKLRAAGILTSDDGHALTEIENLLQKKALTDRPEPSLDSESPKGDN
jgi:hypothetical protein